MILTKNELEIEALKKEIIACNALDSAKEGFSKVEQLEKLVNTDDNLEKQFILRSKALLGYLAGRYTKEEKLRMLIQAIGLTIPDFDLEIIGFICNVDEMKIINQIAGVYSDMGQNKKAADIYYQLLKYVQKHQREAVISSGMLPMVLGNGVPEHWIYVAIIRMQWTMHSEELSAACPLRPLPDVICMSCHSS